LYVSNKESLWARIFETKKLRISMLSCVRLVMTTGSVQTPTAR
jgi:hypothetical protein